MPRPAAIKVVLYDNIGQGKSRVAYVLLPGQRCVFTGLTHVSRGTSTMDAADAIMARIAKAAKIEPKRTTFCDLQTGLGYGQTGKPTGKFHFSELLVDFSQESCRVCGWMDDTCPPEVITLFAAQIGPNPQQVADAFCL